MDKRRLKKMISAMNNPGMLQEIGLAIVKDVLKRAGEVERGQKPDKFSVCMVFKKGDVIPQSFRGLPNIKIDVNGTLLEDWTDGWCQSGWDQSGGWENTWGECWDNSEITAMAGGIHYGNPVEWVKKIPVVEDFTTHEIEILRGYGIDFRR